MKTYYQEHLENRNKRIVEERKKGNKLNNIANIFKLTDRQIRNILQKEKFKGLPRIS